MRPPGNEGGIDGGRGTERGRAEVPVVFLSVYMSGGKEVENGAIKRWEKTGGKLDSCHGFLEQINHLRGFWYICLD